MTCIKKHDQPVSARDLYQMVSKKDNTVSLATVYRTLALLKKTGIINQHRLGKSCWCYELKKPFEHQHILCRHCARLIEFESPLIIELIKQLQATQGFVIERVDICIQGICQACQSQIENSQEPL